MPAKRIACRYCRHIHWFHEEIPHTCENCGKEHFYPVYNKLKEVEVSKNNMKEVLEEVWNMR